MPIGMLACLLDEPGCNDRHLVRWAGHLGSELRDLRFRSKVRPRRSPSSESDSVQTQIRSRGCCVAAAFRIRNLDLRDVADCSDQLILFFILSPMGGERRVSVSGAAWMTSSAGEEQGWKSQFGESFKRILEFFTREA